MKFGLMLIDGNYWARRMFAVHHTLLAKVDGKVVRTGLSHGFLLGLANLKEQYEGKIIVCWDSTPTRRIKIDPTYKAERRERKREWDDAQLYADHLEALRYFLKLTGVRQARAKGEEGDDLMYTLAKRSEERVLLITNDHDLHQALDENIWQLLSKKEGEILYSAKRLERDTGLTPEQYSQAMAIAGCSGDGVAGVPGVGLKTAAKWVKEWPDVVPVLLGREEGDLSDWSPEVTSANKVKKETLYFDKGDKGPPKKLRDMLEDPSVVYLTERLVRLYEVGPITFSRNKYNENEFVLQLERAEMHECAGRIDALRRLHR